MRQRSFEALPFAFVVLLDSVEFEFFASLEAFESELDEGGVCSLASAAPPLPPRPAAVDAAATRLLPKLRAKLCSPLSSSLLLCAWLAAALPIGTGCVATRAISPLAGAPPPPPPPLLLLVAFAHNADVAPEAPPTSGDLPCVAPTLPPLATFTSSSDLAGDIE